MALATTVAGAAYMGMGVLAEPVVAGALFAAYGLAVIVWNVQSMSLRQALVPAALFGRVYGAWRTLVWGAIPLASLGGGLLAAVTNVRTVFIVSGVLQVLGVTGVVAMARGSALATPR